MCNSLEGGAVKYQETTHTQNILFIAMAVETFGGWGLENKPFFATHASRISCRINQAKPNVAMQPKIGHQFAEATCQINDCQAAIVNCVTD